MLRPTRMPLLAKEVGRKLLKPTPGASGAHTVVKRNPITSEVDKYATFQLQTNPKNPNPWEIVKRYDSGQNTNHYHLNKVLRERIYTPHMHDPFTPGGVRMPEPWEVP